MQIRLSVALASQASRVPRTWFTDRRVRHLPVLDGRELVGIVSIGDAVKARMEAVEAQTAAMREYILS